MSIIDAVKQADTAAFKFININLHNELLSYLMRFTANDIFLIIVLAAGLFLLGRHFGKKERADTAFALWSIIAANAVNNNLLKEFFKRQRPYMEVEGANLLVVMKKNGFAFPSTHTAMAAALAAALWDNKAARPYLAAFVLFVGFFCVYTGGHYPLDVLAGLFAGIVIGRIMNLLKKQYLKGLTTKESIK